MGKMLRFVLMALIAICMFDPADKLLGMKVPLFSLAWVLFTIEVMGTHRIIRAPIALLIYLAIFISIPILSIGYYSAINSDLSNYEGFLYLKSYFFLTLAAILCVLKIDLIKVTVGIISLLSFLTLTIMAVCHFIPGLITPVSEFGARNGIFSMGLRLYGGFILPDLFGVYFHVSDVIVFPIAYFAAKIARSEKGKRTLPIIALVINMAAMFFSATRNNIVASLSVPLLVGFWYSKNKRGVLIITVVSLALCALNLDGISESMFGADNISNKSKLEFFEDYMALFSDTNILLFGQGIGSFFQTASRGAVSVTELTYFEFIRRFGIFLSLPAFVLLLYPLKALKYDKYSESHYLFIAYFFYLVMAFFNPFLMSSNGMTILSLVLYKLFTHTAPPSVPYGSLDKTGAMISMPTSNTKGALL